jgi:hypothetical protein
MARTPTAKESARRILDTFLQFNCRPGYVLGQQQFFTAFLEEPWHTSDILTGLCYAAEQGWVEILDKNKFQLTELGFSRAGEDDEMNLFSQCNERVTVEHAADSSRHENVPVLVTDKRIFIPDVSIPLAPDDVILRELPSGAVES